MLASHRKQWINIALLFVVVYCAGCTMERTDPEVYEMLDQALLHALASQQVRLDGSAQVLVSNQIISEPNTLYAQSRMTDYAAKTMTLDLEELRQVPKLVRMRSIPTQSIQFDIEIAAADLKPFIEHKLTVQLEELKMKYSHASVKDSIHEVRQQALEQAMSHMNEMMDSLNIHAHYQLHAEGENLELQSLNTNTYLNYVSHGESTEEIVRSSYTFEYGGVD